jgi:CarD family transcriptional regulator
MPEALGFRRRSAMSTRKKAPKKSANRPSKATIRPSKASSSAKSKDAKISAKSQKSVRPAKRAAAKGAKVSSRAPAAKAKAKVERAKARRVAAPAKRTVKRKVAAASKAPIASRTPHASAKRGAPQTKERAIVSAAKKKSESVKKGQDRLSTAGSSKTVHTKSPAISEAQASPRELPKAVNPPAAIVGLEPAAATARPVKVPVVEKPATPDSEEAIVQKAAKSSAHRQGFKTNEFIVYPAHGVGQIVAVEEQEVAGFRLELFVITFVKDKMTLRVPTGKVVGVGMRKLAEPEAVKKALEILLGRARIKRTMWSRRAQEYETKINSGDLTAIAEVVRDLYRSEAQPEQSYSERQLYEAALDRMAREVAVVQKLTESEALKAIDAQLQKGQRRGAKVEPDVAAPGAGDADVEEAA